MYKPTYLALFTWAEMPLGTGTAHHVVENTSAQIGRPFDGHIVDSPKTHVISKSPRKAFQSVKWVWSFIWRSVHWRWSMLIAGNTPLIYSSMVGNDTAIEVLIRSFRRLGLNVDHINNEGLTALLIAAKNGFTECASILALDGKACVSFRDREKGMNAEEWARAQGCTTPEVLPFSPQAALLGYKYSRIDDEGGAAGGSLSPNEDRLPRVSPPGSARRRGRSSGNKHLDLDDVTNKLEKATCSGTSKSKESKKVQTSPQSYEPLVRGRLKRSSLPTIKFSSFFSAYSHERRERKSSSHNTDSGGTLSVDPDSTGVGVGPGPAGDSSPNMEETRRSGARRKSRDAPRNKSKSPATSAHTKKSQGYTASATDSQDLASQRRPSTNTTLASTSKIDVDWDSNTNEGYNPSPDY